MLLSVHRRVLAADSGAITIEAIELRLPADRMKRSCDGRFEADLKLFQILQPASSLFACSGPQGNVKPEREVGNAWKQTPVAGYLLC